MKRPSQKVNLFVELREKNSRFSKQLLRAIFYIIFGFILGINTQDQAQITSIDKDANSKKIK